MTETACVVCEKPLTLVNGARQNVPCSRLCKMIYDGSMPREYLEMLPSVPCAHCKKPAFMNKNFIQPRYCSKRCSKQAAWNRKNDLPEDYLRNESCLVCGASTIDRTKPGPSPSYCGTHQPKPSRRTVQFLLPAYGIEPCVWCGDWYARMQPDARTCSKACSDKWRKAGSQVHERLEFVLPITKHCAVCGLRFETKDRRKVLCGSKTCKSRHRRYTPSTPGVVATRTRYHARRREAEENGDRGIRLIAVWDRDGGSCAACSAQTPHPLSWGRTAGVRNKRGTFPTVDHIIPLSLGGTHTWDNVQLMCHSCNSRKGNGRKNLALSARRLSSAESRSGAVVSA